jgi:hypothetical protein
MQWIKSYFTKKTVLLVIFAVLMLTSFSSIILSNNNVAHAADTYLNLDDHWKFYQYGNGIIAIPPDDQTQDRMAFFTITSGASSTKEVFEQKPNKRNFGNPGNGNPVLMPPGCHGAHIDSTYTAATTTTSPSGGIAPVAASNSNRLFRQKDSCNDQYWSDLIAITPATPEIIEKAKAYDAQSLDGMDPNAGIIGAQPATVDCNDNKNKDNPKCADKKESGCSQALTPFGWILCPITTFADDIVNWYQGVVKSILYISPSVLTNSGLKQVWRIFSNLASAMIVLIALVMIAGQIFNFEIFSAYTVKKVLPRLVIGAILIQLSWFLCATLIQLTNAVGSGIYWLLLSPFKYGTDGNSSFITFEQVISYGAGNTNVDGSDILANAVGLVGAGGVAAVGIASGAWIMLIVAAIGVLISLIVALVTLMLRAMFVVILLVLAPVAIAAWILPGTQRFWDMWWKMFSKLLMMFPLIMLLFAGGVMAATVLKAASGASPTNVAGAGVLLNFAVLVAYFAPIFMISMTYKFAGGAFASIATLGNKAGGIAKGWSKKGGESGGKKLQNWSASKYNPDGGGFKNAMARVGSGTALPSHRNKLKVAGMAATHRKEEIEKAGFLQQEAMRNMPGAAQSDWLLKQAIDGDSAESQAAYNSLIARGDFDQLEQYRDHLVGKNGEKGAMEFQRKLTTSGQFGTVASARRDLSHATSFSAGMEQLVGARDTTTGQISTQGTLISGSSFAKLDKSFLAGEKYKEDANGNRVLDTNGNSIRIGGGHRDALMDQMAMPDNDGIHAMVRHYATDTKAFQTDLDAPHQDFVRDFVARNGSQLNITMAH